MSIWGRSKTLAGGNAPIPSLASATTLAIPDADSAWVITGTTTVATLSVPQYLRARLLTFIGGASASVTFTNTNTTTVAGQMYLRGQDLVLNEDYVLVLLVKNDGTITLVSYSG